MISWYSVLKEGMDQWLLAVTSGSVTKGLAEGLEVVGPGPVHCHFPLHLSFLPCVVHNVVFRLHNHGTLTINDICYVLIIIL